jgi:hypothetical protein
MPDRFGGILPANTNLPEQQKDRRLFLIPWRAVRPRYRFADSASLSEEA